MTNLKRIIDEKCVQQRWLAEQVGVTEVSMSRYVSGDRIPKAPIAIRMADVLGVDVKELYGWDDEHVVGESEQPETHEKRTETHSCDCISRQAAIDEVCKYCKYYYNENVIQAIKDLPSAQPEIIRCKECKFYTEIRPDLNTGICDLACRHLGGDGFCSEAERRTDE